MPRDVSFETPEVLFGYIERLLGYFLDGNMLLFHLDDPEDIGTLRLVFSGHRNSPPIGHNMEQYLGTTVRESWPSVLGTPVGDAYAEAMRTQKPQILPPFKYSDEKTPERVLKVSCFPLSPRIMGMWTQDITHLERLEADRVVALEQVRLQALELERSNQELESFAYVASHDLKAPLRNIESLATWIAEDVGDSLPPRSALHLQRMRDRVTRMQALLDDLLEYSRVGRMVRPSETIDLAKLLENVRSLVAPPPGIEVVMPEVEGMPAVHTPKAPLEQILLNLVSNAVKHRDEQSTRVDVSWSDADDFIEFTISDDGPGIAPEYQERIFRLFTTLRPRDQIEGSGMGLAIVKKLVEAHGGSITVESEGRGTTFRFTWPKEWQRQPLQREF